MPFGLIVHAKIRDNYTRIIYILSLSLSLRSVFMPGICFCFSLSQG
jgi:hypothetical protein